jgi:hypothetical protein
VQHLPCVVVACQQALQRALSDIHCRVQWTIDRELTFLIGALLVCTDVQDEVVVTEVSEGSAAADANVRGRGHRRADGRIGPQLHEVVG